VIDQSRLERRYRRLLACYPRAFRREHEEEMLVVLLACAREGRRRPGIADSLNLLRNALWVRLRPVAPRSVPTVFWGVRLMVLAAACELIAMGADIVSESTVRMTVVREFPHVNPAHLAAVVHANVVAVEIGAPIVAALWIVLAWAGDRGRRWARVGALAVVVLNGVSLLAAVAQHAAADAPADLAAGIGVCVVGSVATLLIALVASDRHFDRGRRTGRRDTAERHAPGAGGCTGPAAASRI
jgi:hypothetical protein